MPGEENAGGGGWATMQRDISFWKTCGRGPWREKAGEAAGQPCRGIFLKGNNLRERGLGEMLRDRAVGWGMGDGDRGERDLDFFGVPRLGERCQERKKLGEAAGQPCRGTFF